MQHNKVIVNTWDKPSGQCKDPTKLNVHQRMPLVGRWVNIGLQTPVFDAPDRPTEQQMPKVLYLTRWACFVRLVWPRKKRMKWTITASRAHSMTRGSNWIPQIWREAQTDQLERCSNKWDCTSRRVTKAGQSCRGRQSKNNPPLGIRQSSWFVQCGLGKKIRGIRNE